jgi:hypothetical protein
LNHQNFIKEKQQVTRHKKYQNNTAEAEGEAHLCSNKQTATDKAKNNQEQ